MPGTGKQQEQILLVDRDSAAVDALRQTLSEAGFIVRTTTDVTAAPAVMAAHPPDLVIIASGLVAEQDVVTGLDLGADDYVLKPYSLREVVARAAAVLRSRGHGRRRPLTAGDLILDHSMNRVTAFGRPLNLRAVEYRLLEFLMQHPDRTLNRAELLEGIWGAGSVMDRRTVDVNVLRLRKLLGDSGCEPYLQTVRGFGYRFSVPASAILHMMFEP